MTEEQQMTGEGRCSFGLGLVASRTTQRSAGKKHARVELFSGSLIVVLVLLRSAMIYKPIKVQIRSMGLEVADGRLIE